MTPFGWFMMAVTIVYLVITYFLIFSSEIGSVKGQLDSNDKNF